MKNAKKIFLGILLVVLTIAYINGENYIKNRDKGSVKQYAWIVYWDAEDGIRELNKIKNDLAGISVFAIGFDERGKFVYPPNWLEINSALNKIGASKKYLTIVNDVFSTNGKTFSKDQDVLKLFFQDESSSLHHAENIVEEVKRNKYDGLEIDYEGLWADEELIKKYQKFLKQLSAKCVQANLPLRIVLEPSAPFGRLDWPQGPEYVVMLYNLYGSHSTQEGPKATSFFIVKTIFAMRNLPSNKGVAFSTGGCTWVKGSKGNFVNGKEIMGLSKYKKEEPVRDMFSHAMHFSYEKSGRKGSCWYADDETLRYWANLSQTMGIKKIFIWRL